MYIHTQVDIKKANKESTAADYQCNDVLQHAKILKKNPVQLAAEIIKCIETDGLFSVQASGPGFLNIFLKELIIEKMINNYVNDEYVGFVKTNTPLKVVVDYAGMNVAKTMHVGHLRSSIIGDAICRIGRFIGHTIIGDAHLGDWGTPMGIVLAEIQDRYPTLPYFDPYYKGDYPTQCPVTSEELLEIYPHGSNRNKDEPEFAKRVQEFTKLLQSKQRGIYDL